MSDEHADFQTVTEEEPPRPEPVSRRRSSGLGFALVVIVLVILAFMLLRGCNSVQSAASRRSSTNQIVPVEGRDAVDGEVSVWVHEGTEIQDVIRRAGVTVSHVVNMGGGRYVLSVKPGTEIDTVRAIRGLPDVYDAGRVYGEPVE